jgi:hypothetical protein
MQQPNCSNTSLTVTSVELIAGQCKTIQYNIAKTQHVWSHNYRMSTQIMMNVKIGNFMKPYIKQNKYSGSRPFCSCIHQHNALDVGHSENKWFKVQLQRRTDAWHWSLQCLVRTMVKEARGWTGRLYRAAKCSTTEASVVTFTLNNTKSTSLS